MTGAVTMARHVSGLVTYSAHIALPLRVTQPAIKSQTYLRVLYSSNTIRYNRHCWSNTVYICFYLRSQCKWFCPKIPIHKSPSIPLLSRLTIFSSLSPSCLLLLILLSSSLASLRACSLFFPPSLFSPPAGTVCWLNIWTGYWVLEGLSLEDQQRRSCTCWGLAACFIVMQLPACLGLVLTRQATKSEITIS